MPAEAQCKKESPASGKGERDGTEQSPLRFEPDHLFLGWVIGFVLMGLLFLIFVQIEPMEFGGDESYFAAVKQFEATFTQSAWALFGVAGTLLAAGLTALSILSSRDLESISWLRVEPIVQAVWVLLLSSVAFASIAPLGAAILACFTLFSGEQGKEMHLSSSFDSVINTLLFFFVSLLITVGAHAIAKIIPAWLNEDAEVESIEDQFLRNLIQETLWRKKQLSEKYPSIEFEKRTFLPGVRTYIIHCSVATAVTIIVAILLCLCDRQHLGTATGLVFYLFAVLLGSPFMIWPTSIRMRGTMMGKGKGAAKAKKICWVGEMTLAWIIIIPMMLVPTALLLFLGSSSSLLVALVLLVHPISAWICPNRPWSWRFVAALSAFNSLRTMQEQAENRLAKLVPESENDADVPLGRPRKWRILFRHGKAQIDSTAE